MLFLATPPTPTERALGQLYREEFSGLATVAVTLSMSVAQTLDGKSLLLLFKNGALLSEGVGASKYTVTGLAITLGTAAIAGDIFIAYYHYRT